MTSAELLASVLAELLASVLCSAVLPDASETLGILCERLGATDDERVPDAAVLPAIEAAAPVPAVMATHTLLPQLPRGLAASPTSTLALPLNSEVAACGSVLPTTPPKFPVPARGASEIELASPAIALAVWPDPQVARFISSEGSVVAVVDVARLPFPQLAIAAVVPRVALTLTRAFILLTHRHEDGFAVRTAVNMLRANCRGEGRAAIEVRGRSAGAAVAAAAPRLPRSNGRIRCVGAVLG